MGKIGKPGVWSEADINAVFEKILKPFEGNEKATHDDLVIFFENVQMTFFLTIGAHKQYSIQEMLNAMDRLNDRMKLRVRAEWLARAGVKGEA